SPLQGYFSHAPEAHTFSLGNCPIPGHPGFPTTVHGTRLIHYATSDQFLLHNVAGTYYDSNLQWLANEQLSTDCFESFALALPDFLDEQQFLCVVDSRSHSATLPQHGESCQMRFSNAKVTRLQPTFDLEELIHCVALIMVDSFGERDSLAFAQKKAEKYLT